MDKPRLIYYDMLEFQKETLAGIPGDGDEV
jgi:hypothetical protein